jgi:hypothetical protein
LPGVLATGEVRSGSIKRVASVVSEGSMAVRLLHQYVADTVMPEPQMLIPFSRQKFDAETGDLMDKETRDRLRRFLSALAEWTTGQSDEPLKAHYDRLARVEVRRPLLQPLLAHPRLHDDILGRLESPIF